MEGVFDLDAIKEKGTTIPAPKSWEDIQSIMGDTAVIAVLAHVDDKRAVHVNSEPRFTTVRKDSVWGPREWIGVPAEILHECTADYVNAFAAQDKPDAFRVNDRYIHIDAAWNKGEPMELFPSIDAFVPPAHGRAYVAFFVDEGVMGVRDVSNLFAYAQIHGNNLTGASRVERLRNMTIEELAACYEPHRGGVGVDAQVRPAPRA
jgi:hypothetical protein